MTLWVAAAFRLSPMLDNRFHPDEALYGSFARLIASGHDPLLAGVLVDKPPLPFYLTAASVLMFGDTEFSARLPSLWASLLSVALLFQLGRRLYDIHTAQLAALLLSLSPFAILFSITLFVDPLLTCAILWGLSAASRQHWRGFALAMGAAFAVKQTALLFIPLGLVLGLLRPSPGSGPREAALRLWRSVPPLSISLLIVALLILGWDAARHAAIGVWTQGYADNIPNRFVRSGELWPRAVAWINLLHYVTARTSLNVLLLAGLAHILLRSAPSPKALADRILALYVLLYLAAYWLLAFNVWDRYLLPLLPLLSLLLARVLQLAGEITLRLAGRPASRHLGLARAGLALMLGFWLLPPALVAARSAYPIGGDHGAHDGIDDAARYLRQLPDGSVLYDHWLSWEWSYYLFGAPVFVAWFPSPEALAADLSAFGATSPRYLVVPTWESHGELRAAAAEAGYGLTPRFTSYRRDGSPSLVVYRFERAGQ